jgi:hypothetical protein
MNTLFGFTESQIAWFGVTFCVGALMLYMLFIIGQLAWESKAGKFGTFVLYLALALSMVGFIAKLIIEKVIEHHLEGDQVTAVAPLPATHQAATSPPKPSQD